MKIRTFNLYLFLFIFINVIFLKSQNYLNIYNGLSVKSFKVDNIDSVNFSDSYISNSKEFSSYYLEENLNGVLNNLNEYQISWNENKILDFSSGVLKEYDIYKESRVSDFILLRNNKSLLIDKGLAFKASYFAIGCFYDSLKNFIASIKPTEKIVDKNAYIQYSMYIDSIPLNAKYIRIQSSKMWTCNLYYNIETFRDLNPYQFSKNYKKKIAVFGGSFSSILQSGETKNVWRKFFEAKVDSYSVEGAGFALNSFLSTKPQSSVPYQIKEAINSNEKYDVWILWASTNDFITYQKPIGDLEAFSIDLNNNLVQLDTQNGGISYCINLIRQYCPNAEIYFFGSLPFFSAEYGYNLNSSFRNVLGFSFSDYITSQELLCKYRKIPFLNQWNICNVDEFNYKYFYNISDNYLHPDFTAYRKWSWFHLQFISNGIIVK